MIVIVDYGVGNLFSLQSSFAAISEQVVVSADPAVISRAQRIVLPGVGAFGSAMENLEPFKDVIFEHVNDDKPFLGVCLGQQVLMSSSEESPGVKGLDLFKGHVEKLPEGVKIPHMGWNRLNVTNDSPILEGIDGEYFYFVHSYHVIPDDDEIIAGTCEYGNSVVASLSQNNLFSTQFHPEKSSKAGLKILKNFTNLEI